MSWNPYLGGRQHTVDLSTASSSSSSAVLSSVRAERQAREHQRRLELAAGTIQRVWRGRAASSAVHGALLAALEGGDPRFASVEQGARALVVLRVGGGERARVGRVLEAWCKAALEPDSSGTLAFVAPLTATPDYAVVLALVFMRILRFVSVSPRTTLAASLLASLESLLKPSAYAAVPASVRQELVDVLAARGWVEVACGILETLVAASKKHPLLKPVVALLIAPLALAPLTTESPMVAPILQTLLTVPALPSSIPLDSLTRLSGTLPLFSVLLPAAEVHPALLAGGRLGTERGRLCFLANLATFGITGGMLARNGARGTAVWLHVVGSVLGSLGEGWGRLAEGTKGSGRGKSIAAAPVPVDSDSELEGDLAGQKPPAAPVTPLPANISSKILLLAAPAHISTLVNFAVGASTGVLLSDLSAFILGILYAFRGSPRWEGTLDAVMDGRRGRVLVKQLWREGVRGKWGSTPDVWDSFARNPNRHVLLLLSHIYCHYLLITPDDEFFAPQSNPLTLDEVLELSSIWRDLAFWGYMNGVDSPRGSEEVRALFTRGVTRVSERNARRQFAPEEYWVMKTDMRGFIEAAKFEEEELEGGTDDAMAITRRADETMGAARSRHLSRRELAYIAPRLGLLNNLPMAVPFATRVEVFRYFVFADQKRLGISQFNFSRAKRHRVEIRRDRLAEDGFRQLNALGPALKEHLFITFINEHGEEEAGIDGGGLFKEFLTNLSKEVFDTERGLWLSNYNNELYPNPHSYATEDYQLSWYSFVGRVLGKALYEDILLDVSFAGFFLAKWLGRQSYLDDLASLDKELYRGLVSLKNYADPEELSLNFTMTEDDFGVARSVELVPGGSDIAVTAENRHEYIQLVCKYKLDRQISAQSRAFFAGLSDIIDPKWIRMFDTHELAQLLGGEDVPIDLRDWRKHTTVSGFEDSRTPTLFWRVVEGFTEDQRRALLRFVTSCSRPPLLGFAHLNPGFAIRNGGPDRDRLPTASSCANLLKLPDYKDERMLRQKLLQSIMSGAGFDMS